MVILYPKRRALLITLCRAPRQKAHCFLGTHDFTQFANLPSEPCMNGCPLKTLHRLDVVETSDGLRLELEATGFLYRQVPNSEMRLCKRSL